MKKLKQLLALTLCFAALSGCGQPAASQTQDTPPAASQTAQTRSFTDSVGRTVELPAEISKVAVTGTMAQIVVFSLAPDRMVGLSGEWEAPEYFAEQYQNLPVLGQLYGGKGEMNLEELLSAAPDVVIDVGEPKSTIVEDLDGLSQQTGIPFVHITATLETMPDAYRKLGELLNLSDEAAVLADYCQTQYERFQALSEKVDKKRVLYVTGESGLNVIAKGSYHAEVLDLLTDNVAVVEDPSSKGTGNEVDAEQILKFSPDVILFAPDAPYATAKQLAYASVPAIANGAYYQVPHGPYNWLGFPPSVHRYLGMLWMGTVLYPNQVDYDLYTECAKFFELFYHTELTQEQFTALTANSIGQQG